MIRIYASWMDCADVPEGWRPAQPPGHLVKVPVKNPAVRKALQQAKRGRWMKVYRKGLDRSEVHYFEHESGAAANVKWKRKD